MTENAPFDQHREHVRPEWIDHNGHMNVAYYFMIFDHATDTFYDHVGIGFDYKETTDFSTFTLEGHITYDREVLEGDPVRVVTYLLGFDEKRIHFFHEMYHAEKGYLAATNENMAIHIDMKARRSAPIPASLRERLGEILAAHATLPTPPQVGRKIGLRSKRA